MISIDHEADRHAASEWARAALRDEQAVIFDTETTDLRGYICDIAIIRATNGEVLLNTLINPGVPIEPGAQAVHGIMDADVAAAPRFAERLRRFHFHLEDRRVLVYNAAYDWERFNAERFRLNMHNIADAEPFGRQPWECIMLQYAAWVGDWNQYHGNYRWHKLTGGDHRALGDCQAARRCLQEMAAAPA